MQNLNTKIQENTRQYCVVLEESASSLTRGVSGFFLEGEYGQHDLK